MGNTMKGGSSSSNSSASLRSSSSTSAGDISWDQLTPTTTEKLQQGGMGVVMRAQWKQPHRALSRDVAVKLVFKSAIGNAEGKTLLDLVSAIELEAAALSEASRKSRYVIQVHGIAKGKAPQSIITHLDALDHSVLLNDGQLVGIVMSWAKNGNLGRLLHNESSPWPAKTPERLQLCAQIAEGVLDLHEGDTTIIHGDIKSDNVLLSGTRVSLVPLLSDFGLSERRRAAERDSAVSSLRLATERRGTSAYKAPEMIYRGKGVPLADISRSTDVYATGTLIWEVLTGQVPWNDVLEFGRCFEQISEGITLDLSKLPGDTPPSVVEIIKQSLSPDRSLRPRAGRLVGTLLQASQMMSSGKFDIFLSHAWHPSGKHEEITTEVYLFLQRAGYRVWIDMAEMKHSIIDSMTEGIKQSACVVALISERYSQRDNCMFEIKCASEQKKPVVACSVDPFNLKWFPEAGSELHKLVHQHLVIDFNAAAAAAAAAANLATTAANSASAASSARSEDATTEIKCLAKRAPIEVASLGRVLRDNHIFPADMTPPMPSPTAKQVASSVSSASSSNSASGGSATSASISTKSGTARAFSFASFSNIYREVKHRVLPERLPFEELQELPPPLADRRRRGEREAFAAADEAVVAAAVQVIEVANWRTLFDCWSDYRCPPRLRELLSGLRKLSRKPMSEEAQYWPAMWMEWTEASIASESPVHRPVDWPVEWSHWMPARRSSIFCIDNSQPPPRFLAIPRALRELAGEAPKHGPFKVSASNSSAASALNPREIQLQETVDDDGISYFAEYDNEQDDDDVAEEIDHSLRVSVVENPLYVAGLEADSEDDDHDNALRRVKWRHATSLDVTSPVFTGTTPVLAGASEAFAALGQRLASLAKTGTPHKQLYQRSGTSDSGSVHKTSL